MQLRQLRLVAVLAVVVLALTGFSGKSKSKSHSKGGGCSSSHSNRSSGSGSTSGSSSDPTAGYTSDSTYSPSPRNTSTYRRSSSSPSSSGSASPSAQSNAIDQVTVVQCHSSDAGVSRTRSQLRIDNSRGTTSYYFTAVVRLTDAGGRRVGTATLARTLVKARSTKTVDADGTLDEGVTTGQWAKCVVDSANRSAR